MVLGGRLPGGTSRATDRAKAVAFVVLITVVAALSAPAGSLYAQVYPDASTTVVADRTKWQRAYAKASLRTDHPETLVENEAARFTATIVYGRDLDPGRTIDVAYANDATLRPVDPDKAHVVPRTGERQNLDEGTPDGRGGLQLTWEWDVTPRSTGVLTLTLEVQPFVVLGDQVVDKLARRNESIRIDVEVHPNRARFDTVVTASDQEFAPTIPPKITAEQDTVVTADLPLHGQGDAVHAMLTIVSGEGSVPLTIKERAPPTPAPDSVHGEWIVRAAKDGVAKLTVTGRDLHEDR